MNYATGLKDGAEKARAQLAGGRIYVPRGNGGKHSWVSIPRGHGLVTIGNTRKGDFYWSPRRRGWFGATAGVAVGYFSAVARKVRGHRL